MSKSLFNSLQLVHFLSVTVVTTNSSPLIQRDEMLGGDAVLGSY